MSTLPEYYSYIEPNHLIHGNYIRTNINIELSKIYENFRQQNDVFTINLNFYLYKQNAEVGLIGIFPEQFYDSDINYFEEYNFKINLEKLKDKLKDFLNIPIKQSLKYVNLIQDKFYRLIDFKTNTFSDKTYSMTNANYLSTNPMIKYIISYIPIRYMKINVEDKENEFFIRVDNENFKRIFIRKEA